VADHLVEARRIVAAGRRGDDQRGRGERGVALVEFALLLPFIAMLVFGTVDLGRGFSQQNRLKNASREGASWAQLHPNRISCAGGSPDINDIVTSEDAGLTGLTVTVKHADGTLVSNDCNTPVANPEPADTTIVVQVSAKFDVLTPFVGSVTGDPITQRADTKIQVQ
jgi:Flp pilus assembly protein TadG